MSIFEEMFPYRNFESIRDVNELQRMLDEAISRGCVEELTPLAHGKLLELPSKWYRDKESGEIYSLTLPWERGLGHWERIDVEDFIDLDRAIQ